MDFQRSRVRRRRVFREETGQIASGTDPDQSPANVAGKTARNYSQGARKRQQPRTTDLIPKRPLSFSILVGGLVLFATGLTVLYCLGADWTIQKDSVEISIGNQFRELLHWLCNVLLITSAVLSLQIYALRRHRRDDYCGSYRLWAWLAAGLLIGSACSVVDLATVVGTLTYQSIGWTVFRAGSLFWLAFKIVLVLGISTRIIFEVRQSLGSSIVFCATATLLLATILFDHQWFRNQFMGNLHVVFESSLMWSTLLLTIGMLTFARFVYLDAHALVRPTAKTESASAINKREKKAARQVAKIEARKKRVENKLKLKADKARADIKSQSDPDSSTTTNTSRKTKHSSSLKTRSSAKSDAATKSAKTGHDQNVFSLSNADRQLLETDESDLQQLSKSDRRRLRKLQKRQRQAA